LFEFRGGFGHRSFRSFQPHIFTAAVNRVWLKSDAEWNANTKIVLDGVGLQRLCASKNN